MKKRAVNLEGLADRLRLRVLALELGGLPAFLRLPAERGGGDGVDVDRRAAPERPRPEPVSAPPRPPRPRSYEAGGRLASMVELIGR